MALYRVEIIEERTSHAFVSAPTRAIARTTVARAAMDGECGWIGDAAPVYVTGEIEEIAAVPAGYEVDFDADEADDDDEDAANQ